jgi:hypothetical protein
MSSGSINILTVVDVDSILAGGDRWYMVDDDTSSQNEGSRSLQTQCTAGDTLYFRVAPLAEQQKVALTAVGPGPGGVFVFGFNQPVNQGNNIWSWQTQHAGSGGYSVALLLDGTTSLTVTGSVQVQAATEVVESLPVQTLDAAELGGAFQTIDIVVAVNTQAILAGLPVINSVFMMDNSSTSSGVGSGELNTGCSAGDTLRWHCVAINGIDTVTITGFEQSSGNAFGNNLPHQLKDQWLWTTANPGTGDTYQIRILINGFQSASWDPFVTVRSANATLTETKRPAALATA